MTDNSIIENRAEEVPFSYVLSELLETNVKQNPHKMKTFKSLYGVVAIDLKDIEAAVTLVFSGGKARIEQGIVGKPDIVIRTDSDKVIGLNSISIKFGLPWYFDEAGVTVLNIHSRSRARDLTTLMLTLEDKDTRLEGLLSGTLFRLVQNR